MKCGLGQKHYWITVLGLRVRDTQAFRYCGSSVLKKRQRTCSHEFQGRGRFVPLFGARELAYSSVAEMHCLAIQFELAGFKSVLPQFQAAEPPWPDWCAWFVQESTGQDFGVTWDNAHDRPIVPASAVTDISAWWEATGKDLFGEEAPGLGAWQ